MRPVLIIHKKGNAIINLTPQFIEKLTAIETEDLTLSLGEHSYMLRLVSNPDRSDQLSYQMHDMSSAYTISSVICARIGEYWRTPINPEAEEPYKYLDKMIEEHPEMREQLEELMRLIRKLN